MRLPRILVLGVALAAITLTACTSEAQQEPEQPAGQQTSPAAQQPGGVSGRAVKVAFSARAPITAGSRRSPTTPVRRPTSLGSSYCFLRAPTTRLPRSPRSRRSSARSRTCW